MSDIKVDSCGAAAIIYMPDGRRLSSRQCAERLLDAEQRIAEAENNAHTWEARCLSAINDLENIEERIAELEAQISEQQAVIDALYADQGKRWIPVEERLPEPGEIIFVIWKPEAAHYLPYGVVKFSGQQFYAFTHWMPLPEGPRDE